MAILFECSKLQGATSKPTDFPVISLETTFFGAPLMKSLIDEQPNKTCLSKCIFVDSTNRSLPVDIYLYHVRDIEKEMSSLITCRRNITTQILLTSDSPTNTKSQINMSIFDFIVSYQSGNEVSWVYDKLEVIPPGSNPEAFWGSWDVPKIIREKSKPILVFVSQCSTDSARELYIDALSRYVPITNYGKCSGIECDENCSARAVKEHYFYLAFENSVCNDYVTDEFWKMKDLIVPIVLNRKVVGNAAPPESFIAVDDFKTVAELASHLTTLMENKEEYSSISPGIFVTLGPGITINTTLISQRPDQNAVESLLSYLPGGEQTSVRNIRGNIFLTIAQQNEQILDYLNEQRGNSSAVYEMIQNEVQALSQNITNSLKNLSPPAQSFVQRRQQVLDNNAIALFDYNGRLASLVNEFNSYNESLKNEIYNFLITQQITGTFVPDLTMMIPVPVALDETTENQLMNMLFLDGANQPIRGFIELIPQEQQTQFNNIISSGSLRKDQITQQLYDLVSGWGPQYEIAYNNTLIQRNQMVQLLMFLSPGLMEPYKTFINQKINLMTNMTITPTQESQSIQALISGFTSARSALKNYAAGNNTPTTGR
ncbi:hypothetical protein FO519_005007 [Halicephalobus sp. NKZ332]|nr:hypothetical protein FO519_005007 [Halicephalobus sp. NKZ332]